MSGDAKRGDRAATGGTMPAAALAFANFRRTEGSLTSSLVRAPGSSPVSRVVSVQRPADR